MTKTQMMPVTVKIRDLEGQELLGSFPMPLLWWVRTLPFKSGTLSATLWKLRFSIACHSQGFEMGHRNLDHTDSVNMMSNIHDNGP